MGTRKGVGGNGCRRTWKALMKLETVKNNGEMCYSGKCGWDIPGHQSTSAEVNQNNIIKQ